MSEQPNGLPLNCSLQAIENTSQKLVTAGQKFPLNRSVKFSVETFATPFH